jgi:hypothetical protein
VSVLASLADVSAGLLYSSESDRPFEPVMLADPSPTHALDLPYLRVLLAVPPDVRCEVRTIDQILARHTHLTDPFDVRTQQIRPRYEALQAIFERQLTDPVALRVGTVEVRVWLLGRAAGALVGLVTTAIET